MIAIVLTLERTKHFLAGFVSCSSEDVEIVRHLPTNLIFGYAANGSIFGQHRDIAQIVQFAEDAQLRKLGDASYENKTQIWVAGL